MVGGGRSKTECFNQYSKLKKARENAKSHIEHKCQARVTPIGQGQEVSLSKKEGRGSELTSAKASASKYHQRESIEVEDFSDDDV